MLIIHKKGLRHQGYKLEQFLIYWEALLFLKSHINANNCEFYPPIGNVYPISENGNDLKQNPPAQNPPPEQTNPPSIPPIVNFSPISESGNAPAENNLTSPNPPEPNNPPYVMDNPHPTILRGKSFSGVIITNKLAGSQVSSKVNKLVGGKMYSKVSFLVK